MTMEATTTATTGLMMANGDDDHDKWYEAALHRRMYIQFLLFLRINRMCPFRITFKFMLIVSAD